MGSYGIGPARIVAAAVEQFADERGISWPRSIAPWDVELVALGEPGTPEREAAEGVYRELRAVGLDVLLDDRDAGPGEKFADAELLGCPLRLTLGQALAGVGAPRGAGAPRAGRPRGRRAAGGRRRGGGRAVAQPPVDRPPRRRASAWRSQDAAAERWSRRGSRSAGSCGLDRSGPPPPQTLAGQPWHVWTIPNAIGFVRLALIPVFLVLAFSSDTGTDALPGDRLRGHRLERLRRRHRGARDRPVQPLRRAAGPDRRPPARHRRRRRVLALRAAAALGAGRARRARAVHARRLAPARCAAASS